MNESRSALMCLLAKVQDCAEVLRAVGFENEANAVETIKKGAEHESFSVAVVGEFNRGKSTLVNRLLGREALPVGDLPTTAVLTRIRFGENEVVRLTDAKGEESACRRLAETTLAELKLQPFGGECFRGEADITVANDWLGKTDIVLCDTPGAGDLDAARAKSIGDMLWQCDGVLIAVSALSPLSLTEKMFVEERVMARKSPFVMVVVTKLDLVDEADRAAVLRFIRRKLASWKLDVPVFVSDAGVLPDELRDEFGGLAEVKACIESWRSDPGLMERRCVQVRSVVSACVASAVDSLTSQVTLLEQKTAEQRDAMIAQKRLQLADAKVAWESLHAEMQKKCTACHSLFAEQADASVAAICERLQIEVGHVGDPKGWWLTDYPYRVKTELTDMAARAEAVVSRQIAADVQWYNGELGRIFRTVVPHKKTEIVEKPAGEGAVGEMPPFGDLDRRRTWCRIGSAALMISGAAFCAVSGLWPLVATIGLGTGASLLSEKYVRAGVARQREMMRQAIASRIPVLVREVTDKALVRLTDVYEGVVAEGRRLQGQWLEGQHKAIGGTVNVSGNLAQAGLQEKIGRLTGVLASF